MTPTTSWGAIIAGTGVATGVTLILIALGSGIGFATMSPWPSSGLSGISFSVLTAIWLIITQWVSASLGGYITGRLRGRWPGTHEHEVFFRDTAHGLVTWSIATLVMAATLGSSVFSSLTFAGNATRDLASLGIEEGPANPSASGSYFVDRLFRPVTPSAVAGGAGDSKGEVGRIMANAVTTGGLSDGDRVYVAQLVSARSGVTLDDAQKRVDDLVASVMEAEGKAKASADSARKAAAEASVYLALSLLVGAFIASSSAALGGRLRDAHP